MHMLPISLVIFLLGMCACVSGMRGRLLNTHPHCRGCRFDLDGIELVSGTRCPECGRLISTGGSSVRIGLRKKRPAVLVLGLLLALLGTGGLSYPLWSQIPAWKNINWYEHLPESMVIDMTIKGNKDARAVVNDRLTPGDVSEEGLVSLVDHAIVLLDDESVSWDEWWGDVLLYALLTGQISETNRAYYLESLSVPVLYLHPEIEASEESLQSELVIYRNPRGVASLRMHDELQLKSPSLYERLLALGYKANVIPVAESNGSELQPIGWTSGGHGGWTPIGNSQFTAKASFPLDHGQRLIQVRYRVSMQIHLNDEVLHEWPISAESQVSRVPDEVEYASKPVSEVEVEELAKHLEMGPVKIPRSPKDALAIEELQTYRIGLGGIQTKYSTSIGLVGSLSFVDGDREIPYLSIASIPMYDSRHPGINSTHPLGWVYRIKSPGVIEYGLGDFERDREFWEKARLRGSVDIVFRPMPELLAQYPRIRVYLDKPVIFRDVKLEYQEMYQDPTSKRWGWRYTGGVENPYKGELLEE